MSKYPTRRAKALVTTLVVLALLAGLSACGSSSKPAAKVASGNVALMIHNFGYMPMSLTVKVGTTITVTNMDAVEHTLTAENGAFDTGTLNQGQSAKFTLNKVGTYPFHCEFHAFMTGTIKVVS